MICTVFLVLFWILFALYGISRIMENISNIRFFGTLEDVLLYPFAVSALMACCIALEWIKNKSIETFAIIISIIVIAVLIIVNVYKKLMELNFGSEDQFNRSKQKTKLMKSAIKGYMNWRNSNNYLYNTDLESLKRLYDFLSQDEILQKGIEEFTFDEMLQEIMYIHLGMELNFSKNYDFVPISAFCFLQPLSFVVAHKNKQISDGELKEFLLTYFNNN